MVYGLWIWVSFNSAPSFPSFLSNIGFIGNGELSWNAFFLERFCGEVSTGAPVRTVGPQELFDQSGFHVVHDEAQEERVVPL